MATDVKPANAAAAPELSYARRAVPKAPLTLYKPSELRGKKGGVFVIAGRANVGKTTLLKTLWDSKYVKTVLVGDARGRTHILPDIEGLSIARLSTYQDYTEFLDFAKSEPNAFDVIVIDTYSEVQGIDLKQRGLYGAEDRMRMKIYNDSHMDMTDQTRTLYDLATTYGVHVILTLWVKPGKDPKTDADITKLYLTNQFEEYFRGIVDYIGVLTLGDAPNQYPPVLSFEPTNTTPQKFSPNVNDAHMIAMPRIQYNPSLGHIIDAFMGDSFPTNLHTRNYSK